MDKKEARALFRYQVISPLLAMDIPRGKKCELYRALAEREWKESSGSMVKVSAEAIRLWLRLYKKEGFEGLKDASRCARGSHVPSELLELASGLKKEVPSRSISKTIKIMEDMGMAPPGVLRRSTLHRYLKEAGLSIRKLEVADKHDLARWQKDHANDLWQSDMLDGPWLSDPENPGRKLKTRLYVFLDDASRLVLDGRFFFKNDLPALELVFKRSLQRYGLPLRCYYDNGLVFRALHMKLVCAELGIHHPVYTKPYRPEGHGKVEAWNRFCTSDFLAEVPASSVSTLDELNELFGVWVENEYNDRVHSELGCTPRERWERDQHLVRYVDEEKLRTVFLWREMRRVDKCGMVSLFSKEYRISPIHTLEKVEVRYNPEHLESIEIWKNGVFLERVSEYRKQAHRPPRLELPQNPVKSPEKPTDYLGFLRKKYEKENPSHEDSRKGALEEQLSEFVALFEQDVPESVFDRDEVIRFFRRYGPFDQTRVRELLENPTLKESPYPHISGYLDSLKGGIR